MLTNYFIQCTKLVPDVQKPGINQVTTWSEYSIMGILDTDSQVRDYKTGRHGQQTEAIFLSSSQLLKGERLVYLDKTYEVVADGLDIMNRGHHYENKVVNITGVT